MTTDQRAALQALLATDPRLREALAPTAAEFARMVRRYAISAAYLQSLRKPATKKIARYIRALR